MVSFFVVASNPLRSLSLRDWKDNPVTLGDIIMSFTAYYVTKTQVKSLGKYPTKTAAVRKLLGTK
jgi:hypothetical protein